MTRGVVYYNRGEKCLIRLAVSLYTLRRSGYAGAVCIIHEGDLPDWFADFAHGHQATFSRIPAAQEVRWALVQKASLWRYTPYHTSLYIDADTVVMRDPSELFPIIESKGFAVTRFCDWTTNGGKIVAGRIRSWRKLIPQEQVEAALAYGPAVNTGVFGWTAGHSILPEWETLTRRGDELGEAEGPMGRIIDETACQVLCHMHPVTIIGDEWNHSVNHSTGRKIHILHCHGGKHVIPSNPKCNLWKDAFWELIRAKTISTAYITDKRTNEYLFSGSKKYGCPGVLEKATDLTIVTAADPNYAARLCKNFARWMKLDALFVQDFIVFAVNADADNPAYDPLRKHTNVRIIPWRHECATTREAAFSAFVFGVAQHVKTKYWMKLDGDSEPTELQRLDWPGYRQYTITASGWHYTKVKGDDSGGPHWLNRLDAWWATVPGVKDPAPMFPKIDGKRHMHKRLRSFMWIERTDFTRQTAKMYGGKLVVPSHDTSQWYVATRLGEPMHNYPFNRYLRA